MLSLGCLLQFFLPWRIVLWLVSEFMSDWAGYMQLVLRHILISLGPANLLVPCQCTGSWRYFQSVLMHSSWGCDMSLLSSPILSQAYCLFFFSFLLEFCQDLGGCRYLYSYPMRLLSATMYSPFNSNQPAVSVKMLPSLTKKMGAGLWLYRRVLSLTLSCEGRDTSHFTWQNKTNLIHWSHW